MHNIEDLVPEKYQRMIYKDECDDKFVLLKFGEAYVYWGDIFRVLAISKQSTTKIKQHVELIDEWRFDDGIYMLDIHIDNLEKVIALGAFKRRPHKNGDFIRTMEDRLAHKIIPCRITKKSESA